MSKGFGNLRREQNLFFKEEGDTSHCSQVYDQFVAKADKRFSRGILDTFRLATKNVGTQWSLILICNAAFNKVGSVFWITSFERVNLRPSTFLPFRVWLMRLQTEVDAADRFFTENGSLFNGMPGE